MYFIRISPRVYLNDERLLHGKSDNTFGKFTAGSAEVYPSPDLSEPDPSSASIRGRNSFTEMYFFFLAINTFSVNKIVL